MPPRDRRREFTTLRIRAAAFATSSCSHTRMGIQPAARSKRVVSASRRRVRSSFSAHHSRFATGTSPWMGHMCQKHPSTKTATRSVRKTMSAFLRDSSSGRASTRNLSPIRWRAARRSISGGVSRRRTRCIRARVSGVVLKALMRQRAPAPLPSGQVLHYQSDVRCDCGHQ